MNTTPELSPEQQAELLQQFGLDLLPFEIQSDIRSAMLAAYCMGIEAAEVAQ